MFFVSELHSWSFDSSLWAHIIIQQCDRPQILFMILKSPFPQQILWWSNIAKEKRTYFLFFYWNTIFQRISEDCPVVFQSFLSIHTLPVRFDHVASAPVPRCFALPTNSGRGARQIVHAMDVVRRWCMKLWSRYSHGPLVFLRKWKEKGSHSTNRKPCKGPELYENWGFPKVGVPQTRWFMMNDFGRVNDSRKCLYLRTLQILEDRRCAEHPSC